MNEIEILLFGDEDDLFGTIVSGGQLQQFRVAQFVHDGHLLVDFLAVGRFDATDVFGRPQSAARTVHQSVNDTETPFSQFFMYRVLFLIKQSIN